MEKELQTILAEEIAEGVAKGIFGAILWVILVLLLFTAGLCIAEVIDKKRHPEKYKEKEQQKRFKKNDVLHELNVISWQYAELQEQVMKQQQDIKLLIEKHYQTNEAIQTNSENIDTLFNKLKK